MQRKGKGNNPWRLENKEEFGRNDRVKNEECVGDSSEGLRPGQCDEDRVTGQRTFHHNASKIRQLRLIESPQQCLPRQTE